MCILLIQGESKAQCIHCDNMLSAKAGAGTTNLLRHIDNCNNYIRICNNSNNKKLKQSKLMIDGKLIN